MKKHKLLAVFLALVLTLTLLPTAALAENEEAQIGETKYAKLADAINAAGTGNVGTEITLLTDVTLTEQLNINKVITLDGNGKTITRTPSGSGDASVKAGILVTAGATIQNLTVSGPNKTASSWDEGEFGIKFYNANGATLTNSKVTAANAGIQINGGSVTMTGTINLSGNEWGGMEVCHSGTLNISGATLVNEGETAACPVLWNDDTKGTITFNSAQPLYKDDIGGDKDHYYLSGEAKVGNNYYYTFADAVAAAQEGDTVTLLDNVTLTAQQEISKNLTIDLNGHNITNSHTRTIKVSKGTLTLTGSGTVSSNVADVGYSVIRVGGEEAGNAGLVVGKDVTISSATAYGITVFGATTETVTINGTIISTAPENNAYDGCAVSTLGNDTTAATITINDGAKLSAENTNAIYMPSGNLIVNGGTITGRTGIYVKSGSTTVKGGTITGNGAAVAYNYYGNGGISTGDALVVDSCGYPNGAPSVSVTGGTFTSTNAQAVASYQTGANSAVTKFISGGTFSSNPDAAYLAPGYKVVDSYRVIPSSSYKVTFDANGGTCNVTSGYTLEMGGLPTPTHSGSYAFAGWYTTDGTQVTALSQITADTALTARWSYIGGSSSSGSSSSGSSNTSTTTEKNPDGSTTTTVTDKTTGTVTETTKETDGTTTTVETKKDGTVTETVKTPEGTTGTVVTDKNGDVTEVKSTVSSTAAKEAAKTGEAVTLPVEVPAAASTEDAPAVQVSVPKSAGSVKVEIPVEKVTPGTVAIIVNADGTEKIVSTSVVTENGVALTLDGNATVKVIDNSKDFVDVPESNVFYNEISSLSAREIMVGKTDDTFDLNSSVTLNQIANVAGRITGAVDVKDFNAGIVWGAENGLKTGSEAATRGEVLKALYVAAGSPAVMDTAILGIFNDSANIPADMAAIVAWAAQNGILKGTADGNANLGVNVTRGQACALAGRAMGALA